MAHNASLRGISKRAMARAQALRKNTMFLQNIVNKIIPSIRRPGQGLRRGAIAPIKALIQ